MTGRRWHVFPIAIALVATTLAGCTDTGVPFGTGITGYDPTLPDIPRGISWEGPGRPKGRMSRAEVSEYRDAAAVIQLYTANLLEDRDALPMDPKLIPTDPISIAEWNEMQAQFPRSPNGGN